MTVEDHSIIGGLGSAVSEVLSEEYPTLQKRIGLNGKSFYIHKFRTMFIDSEIRSGPVWAKKNDPRITFLGNILNLASLCYLVIKYNNL